MPAPSSDPAADAIPVSLPFRTATLSPRKPTRFDLAPDAGVRAAMAKLLGISKVESFRFKGELRPHGRHDYILVAEMQARVVQPCSITLEPVRTELAEAVERQYMADYVLPASDEAELSADDTAEALPEVLDVGHVALEALALALPLYPRAEGARLDQTVFADPGTTPLTDADLKPFAGLAALKAKLGGPDDSGGASS